MLTALDHVIIGVHDLPQATHHFAEKLGLLASGGGTHPTGGTANRIVLIGDTYLELITVQKPAEAQESLLRRLALGDGYLNFVLASNAIEADSEAMRARGVAMIGPQAGELRSADGHRRGWMRSDVERPDMAQHYPFLIQHDSSGTERRFRLAGWQEPPEHPIGAIQVLSTTIAVNDLDEAGLRFQGIYGLPASSSWSEPDWNAGLLAFQLQNATQSFELAAPLSSQGTEQDTTLATQLHRIGEGLYRITLGVQDLAQARRYLDSQSIIYAEHNHTKPEVWITTEQSYGATIVLREASAVA